MNLVDSSVRALAEAFDTLIARQCIGSANAMLFSDHDFKPFAERSGLVPDMA